MENKLVRAVLAVAATTLIVSGLTLWRMDRMPDRDFKPQIVTNEVLPGIVLTITQQPEQKSMTPEEFGAWCVSYGERFKHGASR